MEYAFDMSCCSSEADMQGLRRRLAELALDENVRIKIDALDSPLTDSLIKLLTSNGYTYQPYNENHGQEQYLVARRLAHISLL